ncbi:MAG: hypothetical protein IAE98_07130, partial [Candidatus Kapabacteria bacterium]|nr:hypothetical protein [Candidatus Kapabacteria bacterium]
MKQTKLMQYLIILLMLLFCFIQLKAQTLDSLVNEAMSNNPLIKSLDYKIKASEYKVKSTNTAPPPTIGLEFSQVKEITQDNESKGFNDKTYLWFCLPL